MNQQDFIQAGFSVIDGSDNSNPLLSYLKEHYPSVIRDNEINLNELKSILGLPVDDKVNGYGLNFIGRNFARAKYQQETDKALSLNTAMSKNIDTTQNLVLKGDNLDSLKILKNYYKGQIKCIYIDPPYNTAGEEFIYPDKFDKEEAEVLGLVNLSDDDFARLDFSFKTKKSHNGWLSFMYPRLLLAQELLSDDGVIFISIDDNEQANLKLLCDDVFGEENFINKVVWKKNSSGKTVKDKYPENIDYIYIYSKTAKYQLQKIFKPLADSTKATYSKDDDDGRGKYATVSLQKTGNPGPETTYDYIDNQGKVWKCPKKGWRLIKSKIKELENDGRLYFEGKTLREKDYWNERTNEGQLADTLWDDLSENSVGTSQVEKLFGENIFTNPKPIDLIQRCIQVILNTDGIVLDFFAGSATTGHAVMELNAADGGNRKFILCQIDEPIDAAKKKDEYKFCIENNLPPVISSITIERLNRAGEAIKAEIEKHNAKKNLAESDKKQIPDIGYKVFDSVSAPKLAVSDKGQIAFPEIHSNAISRIYNMIFKVGIDEPSQVPIAIIPDSMYKLGNNYYITDSHKVSEDQLLNALKDGTVYIDGWTASLDMTLQSQKDKVKIVF